METIRIAYGKAELAHNNAQQRNDREALTIAHTEATILVEKYNTLMKERENAIKTKNNLISDMAKATTDVFGSQDAWE